MDTSAGRVKGSCPARNIIAMRRLNRLCARSLAMSTPRGVEEEGGKEAKGEGHHDGERQGDDDRQADADGKVGVAPAGADAQSGAAENGDLGQGGSRDDGTDDEYREDDRGVEYGGFLRVGCPDSVSVTGWASSEMVRRGSASRTGCSVSERTWWDSRRCDGPVRRGRRGRSAGTRPRSRDEAPWGRRRRPG